MFAGKDFPELKGNGYYDPECLMTGMESDGGCTYVNSRRKWADEETYRAACTYQLEPEWIAIYAPRVLLTPDGYVHYTW